MSKCNGDDPINCSIVIEENNPEDDEFVDYLMNLSGDVQLFEVAIDDYN